MAMEVALGMGGGYWEGTSWELADKIIQPRINIGK